MRTGRIGLLTTTAVLAGAGSAHASTLVFVCGKDLCRGDDRGRDRDRLTRVRELTRGPADGGPVFSPDGRFVTFERSGSIWRVPIAGGRATRRGARQPAWGR